MFGKTKKIHFIGIGGIGMSGMAELLFNLGYNLDLVLKFLLIVQSCKLHLSSLVYLLL